jgi:signal transduction histidine kinase
VALLQRRWAADEQASGFLQMITRNADRAAALSQHLLALARRQPLHPVATDVNEVVTTVVALLRQTLNESIVVEEQLEEPLSWVTADRSELEAALLHVAANARDVMPEGGRLTFRTAELLQPAADTGGPEAATASGPLRRSVLISIRETGSQAAPVVSTRMNDAALDSVRSLLEHSHGELKIERDDEGLRVDLYLAARPG